MKAIVSACKRVILTQAMTLAWYLIYKGRAVGRAISNPGEALEAAVERKAVEWQIPIADVLRPLEQAR